MNILTKDRTATSAMTGPDCEVIFDDGLVSWKLGLDSMPHGGQDHSDEEHKLCNFKRKSLLSSSSQM